MSFCGLKSFIMLFRAFLILVSIIQRSSSIDVSYGSPAYKYCECGRKNTVHVSDGHRILGGNETLKNEYPWMALLVGIDIDISQFLCGGSLINDRYVLSAAHCFRQKYTQSQIKVVLGEHDLCLPDVRTVTFSIEKIVQHPKFVGSEGGLAADVMLVKLNMRVTFNVFIRPICLPKKSWKKSTAAVYSGKVGEILGWGVGDTANVSCALRKTSLTVIRPADCWKKLPDKFCAGDSQGQRDACSGDSGGPFQMVNDDGKYELIGIVSSGIGCGDAFVPGLYTDVQHFLPWIYKASSRDSSYCWR